MKVEANLIEAHIFRFVEGNLEFLLLKRAESEIYPGIWQMVTGSVNEGEKAYHTALREIKEETGLIPESFWIVPNVNSFYSPESDAVNMVPVFAAKVNKESGVIISDEHSEYKWVNTDKACELLAWEGQRQSVRTIEQYLLKEGSTLKFVDLTGKI